MLDSRKATGFYRGDAARLVSEAARLPAEPAPADEQNHISDPPPAPAPVAAAPAPAVILDDPQRPPLTPAAPTNQNLRVPRPLPDEDLDYDEPRYWTVGRVVAWLLLAPWYAAVALGALGLDVLFVKDLLGL